LDEHAGVDLLLDVDRWRLDDEVIAVLCVLALPHELRVERRVAWVAQRRRLFDLFGDEVVGVRGRQVRALVGVHDRVDGGGTGGLLLAGWHQFWSRSMGSGSPMTGPSAYRLSIAAL